jgi:predicted DNA-binding transcriptional regulator AlpA
VETLLGNAELGKLLGVSRQRVSQLVTKDDFPAPRAVLIMGSVWTLDDVVAWADRSGRTLNLAAHSGSSVKASGDKQQP